VKFSYEKEIGDRQQGKARIRGAREGDKVKFSCGKEIGDRQQGKSGELESNQGPFQVLNEICGRPQRCM